MSETSILPGAAPAPAMGGTGVPVPPEFDSEPTDDRRRLMIIGGIVAVVVVVIAAFLLLHKGGSSSNSASGVVPHGTPKATAPATGSGHSSSNSSGKSGKVTTLPQRAKRLNVRDPFKPLVVAPVAGTTQQGATTTVSAPPVAPAPVVAPSSAPTTVPVVVNNPPANTPKGQPVWIRLVSVDGSKSATFDVGYPHHKFHRFKVLAPSPSATQGTVFDKVFALLGIQGGSVTLQIGDSTPFDLAKGVAHSV